MHRLQILGTLLLGVALVTPVVLKAQDESKKTTTTTTTTETKRYYDPVEKDYHIWTEQEDHAYRVYLIEKNRAYVEFPKVKVTEQREYFRWRHGHPDSVIVTTEKEEKR